MAAKFKKKKDEELDKSCVEKIYCLKSAEDNYRLQQVVREISEKYLESILKSLVQSQFLTGVRGKGGGYRLTRSPEQYTVGSILRLTEGSLAPVACLEQEPVECPRRAECRTLPMWRKLNALVQDYLDGVTLADLTAEAQSADHYVI